MKKIIVIVYQVVKNHFVTDLKALFTILFFLFLFANLNAQTSYLDNLHGDITYYAGNIHAGNLIRLTFHNNASVGGVRKDNLHIYPGEWPIGTGYASLAAGVPYLTTELKVFVGKDPSSGDSLYQFVRPADFCEGWDPDLHSHSTNGVFYGFEPLPGFLNIAQKEKDSRQAVAMSNRPFTWPAFWPDKMEDALDQGWRNHWDGYFGKDQMNADEESFHMVDDYQYKKMFQGYPLPKPVPSQPDRGGLGLRMSVRGLQWSNPDAEDVIFWLYEIQNFGQLYLDKTVFGINGQSFMGGLNAGNTETDGASTFYRDKAFVISWDMDNRGMGGYTPTPWMGWAYLESPGNPYDGIDNDGDGNDPSKPGGGTGHIITVDDFYKVYKVDDPIVMIDYDKPGLPRTVSKMPPQGVIVKKNGTTAIKRPNVPLIEIPNNGIDDNLNGLIDESDGSVTQDSAKYYLYIRSAYNRQDYLSKDYITGDGLKNLMIDERRDDGLDNDGDWSQSTDDVGLDGKNLSSDRGEGDGKPSSGWQPVADVPNATGKVNDLGLVDTHTPGEPNVDITDVDESDQIGLTSFKYYQYGALNYGNDEQIWTYSQPGFLENGAMAKNLYCQLLSSGYFPLNPGQKEFLSVAIVFGWDATDLIRNKDVVQKIYNANYNFTVAPIKPQLKAVAGNNTVTLYWDEGAEESYNRYLRTYDFEGYKIYKSTYQTFADAGDITDGLGYSRFKKPLAIYDKKDEVYGFFPKDFGTGVLFNLGNETGLVHSYVDHDVLNGVKYFYAVTSYNRGDLAKNIAPTECTMYVSVDASGRLETSENVVTVTPQAPVPGYEDAGFDINPKISGDAITSGQVGINIINPDILSDQDEYEIQFLDESMDGIDNNFNKLIDGKDPKELLPTATTGFVLRNLTQKTQSDTVWLKSYMTDKDSSVLIKNLYDDVDGDPRTFSKITDGMDIHVYNPLPGVINNPRLGIIKGMRWSKSITDTTSYAIQFGALDMKGYAPGTPYPRQLKIVFYNEIVDTSAKIGLPLANGKLYPVPSSPVNFKVYDLLTGQKLPVAFVDQTKDASISPKGFFSAKDRIIFFEKLSNDSTIITNQLYNNSNEDTVFYNKYGRILGAGDTLALYPDLPFNGNTRFRFKVRGQKVNQAEVAEGLNKIKVVPNPYAATTIAEPRSPYTSGRGPRKVDFIHLPQQCTIRIYAVDGTMVRQIDHDSNMRDGSEAWDLLTKDNMEISYGVYVYHVDAPGIGQHVGRILIIK